MGHKIVYNLNTAHTHGSRDFTSRISRSWEAYIHTMVFETVQVNMLTLAQEQKVISLCTNEGLSCEFKPFRFFQKKGIALWKSFCLDIFPLTNVKSRSWSCSSPAPAVMNTVSGSNASVIHKPSPAPPMHSPELHGHIAGTHRMYRGIFLNYFHLPSKRASRELEKGRGHIKNVCPRHPCH